MYPYIQIWYYEISMTGLWAVVFLISFLITIYIFTQRYNLDYYKFFSTFWFWLLFVYFSGRYSYLIIETIPNGINNIENINIFWYIMDILIPKNVNEIISLLSPSKFEFHYLWILISSFLYLFFFIKYSVIEKQKWLWIWILFFSISLSLIPFWFFLLMWDDFVGRASLSSDFFISTFSSKSELIKYDNVYPVWFMLSIWSTIVFLFNYIIYKISNYKNWYFGFSMIMIVFFVVFLYQQYPKHIVMSFFEFSIDIKHYFTIGFFIFFLIMWFREYKKIT